VARDDGLLLVTTEGDVRAALSSALAAEGLPVTHLRVRSGELDDIYVRYFTAAEGADEHDT